MKKKTRVAARPAGRSKARPSKDGESRGADAPRKPRPAGARTGPRPAGARTGPRPAGARPERSESRGPRSSDRPDRAPRSEGRTDRRPSGSARPDYNKKVREPRATERLDRAPRGEGRPERADRAPRGEGRPERADRAPRTGDRALRTADRAPRSTADRAPRSTADRAPRSTADRAPRSTSDRAPRSTADRAPRTGDRAPRTTDRFDRAPRSEVRSERAERAPRTAERSLRTTERAPRGEGRPDRAPRDAARPPRAAQARDERVVRGDDRPRRRGPDANDDRGARPQREDRTAARPTRDRDDRPRAPLLIWGRRPVESLFTELASPGREFESSAYTLHLLGDAKGKVPAQLRDAVEQAKVLGIRTKVSLGHEDENWPLSGDENFNHQRLCLEVPEFPVSSIHDIIRRVRELAAQGTKGCIGIVLDQVQDPRNFGSLLRSAAFFGAQFAVFGEDRQAPISSTVLKASAGGAFALTLAPVVNINRALVQIKDAGAWIVGTALSEKSVAPEGVPIDRPYVLVLGNEAKGMRLEVAKNCDYVVRIPGGHATVDSLNVGVAAGVLLARLASPAAIAKSQDVYESKANKTPSDED